ncbi:hypothetical protein BFP72_10280 [Reichenbachiella sp. 5M10]|nr:hypothetical protein BFP72_10280 [Reichenbachiella sp. 5M10]
MSKIKFILTFLIPFTGTLVFGQNSNSLIPDEIKSTGDSAVLAQLGTEIFERTNFLCEKSLVAIDLAINSGLQYGLGIYNDGLIFDIEFNSFLWRIKNHLTERPDTGELIFIDATTGERIIEKDAQWRRSIIH